MDKTVEEYCEVVRGQLGGELWGWDVVAPGGTQLAHFGTKEKAEAWAEGYTIGRLWKPTSEVA